MYTVKLIMEMFEELAEKHEEDFQYGCYFKNGKREFGSNKDFKGKFNYENSLENEDFEVLHFGYDDTHLMIERKGDSYIIR